MKVIDDKKGKVYLHRLIVRYLSKFFSLFILGAGYWIPMLGNKRPYPDQLSHTMVIALTPSKSKK
jgi:hypothetical protein